MPNFKSILHKKTYALTFRVADYNKKLKLEMNNFQNGKSMCYTMGQLFQVFN